MTIWHLKELSRGERSHINRRNMRTIDLPYYEGLTMDDLLAYATHRENVMRALPAVQHEIRKLPRKYVAEVILNIVGDPFEEWANQQISVRNAKYKEEHDENLGLDEECEAGFQKSTSIACKYPAEGSSFQLVI